MTLKSMEQPKPSEWAEPREVAAPWLTFEVLVYSLIFLAGLLMRFTSLGRWPLLEGEVNTALAAWRSIQGEPWWPERYIPLLYDVHLVLFWLTRATDASARLVPALVGAGLALLPFWARDILGRKGALLAAVLLALAPTWIFFSRLADSPILTATASAALLLSFYRYQKTCDARELRLGAIALGLGLAAGPGIYTALLAGLLWWGVQWVRGRRDERAVRLRDLARGAATRENLLLLGGVFLFVASGFLNNLGGIGASIEQLGFWLRGLAPAASGLGLAAFPQTLFTYEFFTIALAVAGVVWGLRERDPLDAFLIFWAAVGLALGFLGHRQPLWLVDVLLPLVILAARGFERLWDRLALGATRGDGIILALLIPIVAFGFLSLASYMHTSQEQFFTYALITYGLLIAAWVVYALWGYRESAFRVGAALALLLMVLITARATSALLYQTGRDPRESMVGQTSSVQLRDFEDLVAMLSSRYAGDPHAMTIDYEQTLDPWMGWYLRDYPQARAVASVDPSLGTMALVTAPRERQDQLAGYIGQRFRLQETWSVSELSRRERLRWLFYRDPVGAEGAREIELWFRLPGEQQ